MFDSGILNQLLCFFIAAAGSTVVLGYVLLPMLRRLKVRQSIRAEGPQNHLSKAGTPTMGGLIFIVAFLVLFFCRCDQQPYHWIWLFAALSFGLIGFLDDLYKVVLHRNLGLNGKQKLVGQFCAAIILLVANSVLMDRGTQIYLPSGLFDGADNGYFDLGWAYYPIVAIFMVGLVNAVNLTDGLDGLASCVSLPVFIGIAVTALALGGGGTVMGSDMAYYAAVMAGCCLGFLYFNHHPAQVFMGDTGSMTLGGALVGFMLIGKLELLMIGFGLMYLIEALSVMLQVFSFKLTGKRIFLMSPLHHHFELKGWPETKVTAVFCLVSSGFVFITFIICVIL